MIFTIKKFLYWVIRISIIALGIFFIVFGEKDDSPGLQGLGLILVIGTIFNIVKSKKKNIK